MTTLTDAPHGSGTFPRGIHPPHRKKPAEACTIEVLPTPAQVTIPLLQHTGAPNEPLIVKPRTDVTVGQKIGASDAFISAPVHASINGQTARATAITLPNGRHVNAIPIKAGEEQPSAEELYDDHFGGDWPTDYSDREPKEIIEAIKEAGLVGLGGAAFPTYVKLSPPPGKTIDTLLLNGAECEPYLTADYRLMVEAQAAIVSGALAAARAMQVDNIVIAIEDNKPQAVDKMRQAVQGTAVQVIAVKTKYPQGGEKQLILATLKRIVPTGGLPLDVGVVVMNVGTAAAAARAVARGKPLTHRVITVTGAGVNHPKNVLAPVGATFTELVNFCGGLTEDAARLVAGGPMMGFTLGSLDTPVTKGASGLTVLTQQDLRKAEETACVRCGRCVDVCPLNLVPTKIALAARCQAWDLAKRYHMVACMECGCCAYECPASIPLVQLIRMAKAQAPRD